MSGGTFGALAARGRAIAAHMVARRLAAIALAVARDVPGVTANVESGQVVLEGRGLSRRWMEDPLLRDVGRGDL